jgi:hypothetical protein
VFFATLLTLKEARFEFLFNLDPQAHKDLRALVLVFKADTWGSHAPSKFRLEINLVTSGFQAWMISRWLYREREDLMSTYATLALVFTLLRTCQQLAVTITLV